ncbi:hypothetical protein K7432_013757 [Basidiobolus ranarum]|uniref:RING-type domain-containing protein n=1 Tax=Basidiobolus ranarum TaxID=34480 RepID=A0ABR2WIQ9_9FUNG
MLQTDRDNWLWSLRIVSVALACSSWAKASVLQHHGYFFRRQLLTEDEKRIFTFYHLTLAYGVLRWMRHKLRKLPKPPLSLIRQGKISHTMIPSLTALTCSAVVFDELIHLLLLNTICRRRSKITLIGRPAPPGTTDADCCICYGAGIRDQRNAWEPTSETENSVISSDDTSFVSNELYNFCKVAQHVAHRPCIKVWWESGPGDRTCPYCRQPLMVEIVESNYRESNWNVIVSRWVDEMWYLWDWRSMIFRGLLTAGCVVSLCGASGLQAFISG